MEALKKSLKSLPANQRWRFREGFLLIVITTVLSISVYAQKTDTARYADNDTIFTSPVEVSLNLKGE